MAFQRIDLFEVRLAPVKPVEPRVFSIGQLIEQFDAGLSARRFDRYSISSTFEKLIARSEEMTDAQRAEVVDLLFEADPHRIHPGSMRRFFAASWPEAVDLFKEVMGSTDPEDLQWGLSARLALCDTAIRAEGGADRRRLDSAKAGLVAFAVACLGNHELLVDEKAAGLRGILELCARGEIPKNLELEPPKPREGPKEGDEERDSSPRRRGKVGNPHRLPKKSRRGGIPPEKYAGAEAVPAEPAPPPAPAAAPAPTPIPAPPALPAAPTPIVVSDDEVWALLAQERQDVVALKKAYDGCVQVLSSGGALHPLAAEKFRRLQALIAETKGRLEAAAPPDPFAGLEF